MVVIMMGRKRSRRSLVDRLLRRSDLAVALPLQCHIDHHDGIFLHNPDQHDHTHKAVEVELEVEEHQRNECAKTGGGQSGKNGQGMDEALIQDAQHQVDHQDGHHQQQSQTADGRFERLRRALKAGADGCRQHFPCCFAHCIDGIAQRDPRTQIERDGHRRQLAQVIDGERAPAIASIWRPRSTEQVARSEERTYNIESAEGSSWYWFSSSVITR